MLFMHNKKNFENIKTAVHNKSNSTKNMSYINENELEP